MENQDFKYFAFISYSSKDTEWGKRLHRILESYKMPSTLCHERGWNRHPIKPVFFAPTDIQPSVLDEELKKRLRLSKYIIVICSPNSANSEWVGKEIEYFHVLGRDSNIIFFIVDGIPNSGNLKTECFNPIIKKLGLPEILGANIHEKIYRWPWMNRERAYVQLISKLLDVEFDSIWQRHRRQLRVKIFSWCLFIMFFFSALVMFYVSSQPFDTIVSLKETTDNNQNLPHLDDAIITMYLDSEKKVDTIHSIEANAIFRNIPSKYRGEDVKLSFVCPDFITIDTVIKLEKSITLNVSRDANIYGNIHTQLWNYDRNFPISNTKVKISDWEVISDSLGMVDLFVPLKNQQIVYKVFIPTYNVFDSISMPSNATHRIGINF